MLLLLLLLSVLMTTLLLLLKLQDDILEFLLEFISKTRSTIYRKFPIPGVSDGLFQDSASEVDLGLKRVCDFSHRFPVTLRLYACNLCTFKQRKHSNKADIQTNNELLVQ